MATTPSSVFSLLTGYVGRKTLGGIDYVLNLCAFALRLLKIMLSRRPPGRRQINRVIIEQIYFSAVQALPVIVLVALITGIMLIGQFAKLSGQYDMGKLTVFLIIRELGPVLTALLVILRTATAVTTEIGHMNLSSEMEAMERSGVDPLRFLGVPRLIGIIFAILLLFVVFDSVAILGGYMFSDLIIDLPVTNFLNNVGKAISGSDVAVGIVKALFFGLTIGIVCLYQGFKIDKPNRRLSHAVSRAAIDALLFCLFVNVMISVVFYMG